MADQIASAAQKYGIDPRIFAALVRQESGGNQSARSPAGAIGLTQLMPGTAKSLGVNPANASQNLDGGAKYLRQQLDRFGGSYAKALAAYNAGPGAVQKYGGIPPYKETQQYVRNILSMAGTKGSPPAPGASSTTTSSTRTVGAVDNSQSRGALIASFLQGGDSRFTLGTKAQGMQTSDPLQFAMGVRSLADNPGHQVTATRTVKSSQSPSYPSAKGSVASFEGVKVAGWIAPILAYARQRGWKGNVTSGYRTAAQQQQAAQGFGLSHYGPGGPQKSNHRFTAFPGGAVDVTNAQQLAQILRSSPYASKLVWAGAKDQVHFSHPGNNGSY